ncbi:NADP-dependent 3-hydroxy acid dehydrogenase YdfG [Roseovarius tolerans]|uniref:NADP-dependent 3-hydroxy acid dehydrogenase YdfG n=1 Tax=Roseovarius tolerans TaxID=74031 RepID=A0A1H8DTU8_9RHOB|nr:SDR family NAD(P)-dependent oxidoreductase [Roseovarius tolerans]SEN10605.1 NADP-dependent 3-hydroxy acid dehydrogenase YdfG [Roseovarius tolerans]
MTDWQGKRYWLVGASEGLGAALAHKINAAGAEVIVSARSADRLEELVQSLPGHARAVAMDVRDDKSVADATAEVGEVDGLVYLAGVYWPMPSTEWQAEEVTSMADVNFTGAVRILGAVIPGMVARDAGHVVLTGSLSGFRGLPGAIGYTASKAGVMNLAESMRADLWRTGVRVQLANPGFIKTRLTDKNNFKMPFIMSPEDAAQEMFELMCDDSAFQRHFPRLFSYLFRLSRFLPDWAYYRLFA